MASVLNNRLVRTSLGPDRQFSAGLQGEVECIHIMKDRESLRSYVI